MQSKNRRNEKRKVEELKNRKKHFCVNIKEFPTLFKEFLSQYTKNESSDVRMRTGNPRSFIQRSLPVAFLINENSKYPQKCHIYVLQKKEKQKNRKKTEKLNSSRKIKKSKKRKTEN